MELTAYFESKKGIGVLSTADHNGKVGSALYARPHVLEDGTLLFIMRDRLMHANLQSNPQAAYLFVTELKLTEAALRQSREESETRRQQQSREFEIPPDCYYEPIMRSLLFPR